MSGFDLTVVLYVLAIYAAAVLSPGPNFAVVSRLSVQGRRRAAFGVIAGVAITSTFYAVLSMAGLAVVLNQISWLARGVQIGGGLFLVYLGISAWRSAAKGVEPEVIESRFDVTPREFLSGFRLGAVVSLSNPKSIVFFTSLYAAAIPFDAAMSTKAAILLGGFSLEVSWYSFAVLVLSTRHMRAAYTRWSAWIERSIGTVLAYFGLRLILDRT